MLLSTHIVSDVEYIANEILLMKEGKILHNGTVAELMGTMEEGVWKCYVNKSEVEKYIRKYKISNMKSEAHDVELRIISVKKPMADAELVEANLEDLFLYYFGEKAGDNNAEF